MSKERYDKLKAKGLCVRCGINPATPNYVTCEDCRQKRFEYEKEYRSKHRERLKDNSQKKMAVKRQKRRVNGMCIICGLNKADVGYTTCSFCRERDKTYDQRRYYGRKEKGICVDCGKKPAEEGKVLCTECKEKQHAYKNERRKWLKETGYCPKCGINKLFGDEKTCPECLAMCYANHRRYISNRYGTQHDYYVMDMTRLKEKGLCRGCRKNKRAEGHVYCEACLQKKRENDRQRRIRKGGDGIDRSERYSYGLCYRCGNPLDNDDKRLCSDCCEKAAKNFKGIRGTNAYWKSQNRLIWGVAHG